jgi:hypothetical protein
MQPVSSVLVRKLPVPIAMIGDQLSNLLHILFSDFARCAVKNDGAWGGILNMCEPDHGVYGIRIETKLSDGSMNYYFHMH